MAKQEPCCARRTGKLHHDQNNLKELARKAAYHDSKGHDISKFRRMIAETKRLIEMDKQNITDHEADHAAGSAA